MGIVFGTLFKALLYIAVIGACAIVAAVIALFISIWFFVPLWQGVAGMAAAGVLGALLLWRLP